MRTLGLLALVLSWLGAEALAADNNSKDSPPPSGINGFSLGAGVASALGTQYVTLGNSANYEGDVYVSHHGLGPDVPFRFSAFYIPFSVKNLPNSSANLGIIGILGGVEFHSPGSLGHVAPYFGAQVGAGYEFLTFPGGTGNNSQNATISLALRALPGVEVPFSQSVSLLLEVPVMALIGKSTNIIGGGSGLLRFRL